MQNFTRASIWVSSLLLATSLLAQMGHVPGDMIFNSGAPTYLLPVDSFTNCNFCLFLGKGDHQATDLARPPRFVTVTKYLAVPGSRYGPSGWAAKNWTIASANNDPDLNWSTGAFTFMAFFYVATCPGNGEYPNVLGRHNYVNGSNNKGWNLDIAAPNDPNGAFQNKYSCNSYRDNDEGSIRVAGVGAGATCAVGWSHITCTGDGTSARSIYINGLFDTFTTSNLTPIAQSTNGINSTNAGNTNVYVQYAYTWPRALTATEIRLIYLRSTRGFQDSTWAYPQW